MEFVFDADKSAANKAKHGIDFIEAQALWYDDFYVDMEARSDEEVRSARIGKLGGKCWVAIYTLRAGMVRLISVRRAREKERQLYEDHIRKRIRREIR